MVYNRRRWWPLDATTFVQLVVQGVLLGGVLALFAAGLNLIFGVMRVINLAHGELMMLGAYGTWVLFNRFELNPILSLLLTMPVLFLLGLLLERVFIERIVRQPLLISLLLTFGLQLFFTGGALTLFTNDYRSVPYFSGSITVGPIALPTSRTVAFLVALAITVALYLFLQRSRLGKAVRATAQNADVALVCGINVQQIRLITFGLGSALGAASGTLVSTIFSFTPEIGRTFLGQGFSVIVLGGLGSFVGALLGGIIMGIAQVFGAYQFNQQIAEAIPYLILVLVLIFRPSGLFGTRE